VYVYDAAEKTRLQVWARRLVGMSAAALVTLCPGATIAKDRVTVTLSAAIMNTDGELHATIRVDPQDDNRVLSVSLDGPRYYASTDKQLDGSSAARTHDLYWRHIPPGDYAITAIVEVQTGKRFVDSRHMKVIGGAEMLGQ
jgi:hypothetical protein